MPEIHFKERSIRLLPGRVRIEVYGLKKNGVMAQTIEKKLGSSSGILKVQACMDTGRVLVHFDENQVSVSDVMKLIIHLEEEILKKDFTINDELQNRGDIEKEVAVSVEKDIAQHDHSGFANLFPDEYKIIPKSPLHRERKSPPLPLALAIGGIGVLGAKQLFWGRSAVARSSAAFNAAGVVSILTGYPFLKRGFKKYTKESRINSDLLLGTSAFALALVRENLVVLAGLGILQYLNWKRSQSPDMEEGDFSFSPEIQSYSEKASKLGLVLGGATFALTRSPMRTMAVLLAANPRTATMPTEYAWKQAEYTAKKNHCIIPANGSLSKLTRLKGILIDDTSLIATGERGQIRCITNDEEEEKVWGIAASLLMKGNHPWKEEITRKAEETDRTIRTAFCVETEEDGVLGKIHNKEVFIGNLSYMQRHELDCSEYLLQAKRLERHGNMVLFVAKKGAKEGIHCIGLLVKPMGGVKQTIRQSIQHMNSCTFYILNNSAELTEESMKKYGLDTSLLHLTKKGQMQTVSSMMNEGQELIHVKKSGLSPSDFNLPTIEWNQLDKLQDSVNYANAIQQTVDQHVKISKLWNVLGTALAIPYYLAAPVVNLAADGLCLIFLSRAKRKSEAFFKAAAPILSSRREAASALDGEVWHSKSIQSIREQFDVHETKGLNADKVKSLREKYGYNQLSPKESTPWFDSFMGQFKEFTTLILLGAAGLAFFTGGLFDGLAMGAVLVANAAIGTAQERKAEKVVEALNNFQPPVCKVIRDSKEIEISGHEIVPGDIVCLEAGDRIPADLRIIQAWNLEVNEAALTGESLPVVKNSETQEEDCAIAERKNMLYMGTDVTRGKAVAMVVRIGMETEMGHLMALMKGEEKQTTPLQEKVTSISKTFVKGAMIAGALVFVTGIIRGIPIPELITTSITLAASAIPEGLPVTITIALSAGIYRMASKNALIRKLSALETLGRTTVICSDKTGTLTKNEMTVKTIATTSRSWFVTGDGYAPTGSFVEMEQPEIAVASAASYASAPIDIDDKELNKILRISLLCNNSKLEREQDQWNIKGDPTEGALLTLAAKAGLEITPKWSRCNEEPFDSYSGMMSVVCKDTEHDHDCYLFSKGSVEAILRRCHWYQEQGEVLTLTEEKKKLILEQNERMAAEALRVLGFAYSPIEDVDAEVKEKQLIYVGMVGMMDPPKADVKKSIREAYELGVQPVMITGDHPITAIAIAKQLGIWDGKRKVLTGTELNTLTDEQLMDRVEDISIFARVSPEHKLRIVSAFQKRGHIVAMTGDGVNDSPAIKKANVGIAMGRTGTEVTKETADMVLKEDHFGSIVDGVKEGRTIIGNIRKAIGCLLTGNLAEVLVTSAAVVAGMPMPLVPIQILLMNLLTDALPAMILAINPGDKSKNTKRQDIVDKELYQKVITRGVLLGAGSLGLFAFSLAAGAPIAVAQTTAFATLVAGQLLQTFSWRQEGKQETIRDWTKDRFLLGAMGISWIALLSVIYVPALAGVFHAAPLPIQTWIPILAVAGSVSLLARPLNGMMSGRKKLNLKVGSNYMPVSA